MFKKIVLLLIGFFIVDYLFAQGGGFPIDPPNALGAPIDGGLSLLLAAGAAYGAKKVYDFRNKDNQEEENEMK
ncbi:hypothetical protein V9L05_02785 [Bernardetia sp. Wsw4-3y2]|uniref:PID-CTERM protein-sorting domain-containing protein n=1 Tax=unclassified Bernardetia TaxID=2647129 RepID=UPI0030D04FCD